MMVEYYLSIIRILLEYYRDKIFKKYSIIIIIIIISSFFSFHNNNSNINIL